MSEPRVKSLDEIKAEIKNERQVNEDKQKASAVKKTCLDGVVCTNPGKSLAPVYKRVYNKELDRNLVTQVDTTNITEFIQASKSSTDLATLQKRFIELGEIPAVDPTLTSVDTTILPGDIHSLYNMVNDVNGNFNKLPESVRNVFGTSSAYLESILDGSYEKKLAAAFAPKQNKTNEDEKKEGNE